MPLMLAHPGIAYVSSEHFADLYRHFVRKSGLDCNYLKNRLVSEHSRIGEKQMFALLLISCKTEQTSFIIKFPFSSKGPSGFSEATTICDPRIKLSLIIGFRSGLYCPRVV